MSANPWSAVASGVSSSLTFLIKIGEYTYALQAVDQQTKEYSITAQHAWDNIKICRELLDHAREKLSASEVKQYQRVIDDVTKAAQEVALLLEPARVDGEADFKIRFPTRVKWVLSNNPNIGAALRRLDIVHTTLTQNISTLRIKAELGRLMEPSQGYESKQLLEWKRQTRLTPMASMQSMRSNRTVSSWGDSSTTVTIDQQQDRACNTEARILESRSQDNVEHILSMPDPADYTGDSHRSQRMPTRVPMIQDPDNEGQGKQSWLEQQAMKSRRLREARLENNPQWNERY